MAFIPRNAAHKTTTGDFKADVNTDVAKSITALDMETMAKAIDNQALFHVDKAGGEGRGRDGGSVAIDGHKTRCNNQNVDAEMEE